jgi:hypothetical protein
VNPAQVAVLDYISDKDVSTLHFGEMTKDVITTYCKDGLDLNNYKDVIDDELSSTTSLPELISKVLKRSYCSSSLLEDGTLDTPPGKNRSVLDIWRHVKFYLPEVTIFDVMYTLTTIRDSYKSFWCNNIKRRVFVDKFSENIYYKDYYRNDTENKMDEFNLPFFSWKTILED